MKRAACVAVGVLFVSSHASAAGPLGADGSPIRTSKYAVDLTATPVLAGSRVTGLAGAYVAIAEGVDGSAQNPASPGVRPAYSIDHFDYDLGLGLTLPATLTHTDFFNTGRGATQLSDAEQQGFVFVTPAVQLQFGRLGVGLMLEVQSYDLRRSQDTDTTVRRDRLSAQISVVRLQVAHMFFHDQFVLGAGLRASTLSVNNQSAPPEERDLFDTTGAGFEVGAVWMPTRKPFRVGASVQTGVTTTAQPDSKVTKTNGDLVLGDPTDPDNSFWLPERVTQPWELNVGLALQIGPRPLNPGWIDPSDRINRLEADNEKRAQRRRARRHQELVRVQRSGGDAQTAAEASLPEIEHEDTLDELYVERAARETRFELKQRYAQLERSYVLISMSLVVFGEVNDAVGVESFLQRRVARSGQEVVFSPRLGVETELVPRWVKVRGGTYGEPSRFKTGTDRLHGTLGLDVKLFPWTVFGAFEEGTEWRLGGALDGARRYFGWGVSIGVWH